MHRAGADFTLYDLRHTFASAFPLLGSRSWRCPSGWATASVPGGLESDGGLIIDSTTARVYAHGTGEWTAAALREANDLVRREVKNERGLPRPRSV